jgi:glutamyl-tRNA reductase
MGTLAARAVRARGLPLFVASRSQDRAQRLAETCQGRVLGFDPGPGVALASGVIVALAGPWMVAAETVEAIARHAPWVVDLSSPPAVDPGLIARLGPRFLSIDDLAEQPDALPTGSRARLEALVESTLGDLRAWIETAADRDAARALARLAEEVRDLELERLFATVPALEGADRAAVEEMAARLASRLLREPFDRLAHDHDGRYRLAARDLFRL